MIVHIFIVLLLYIIYNRYTKVHFLSKEDTSHVIVNNTPFYQKFSKADLHARKVNSIDEYITKIKRNDMTSYPSITQQFILYICTLFADIRLKLIENKEKYEYTHGISALKWNIGIVNNDFYEGGMAHTIQSTLSPEWDDNKIVIIIPSKIIKNYSWDELIKTMMHEKVHVYQKTFPEKIDNYLKQNQYSKHSYIDTSTTLHRANPDTDSTIYKHSPSNKLYEMTYQSSTPQSISDTVHISYGDEHPFEEMAIHIENL